MKDTKTCPTCAEEIKASAKKCPHCQSWQSKWRFDSNNPKHQLFWTLLIIGGIWWYFSAMLSGADFEESRKSLKVIESELNYSDESCGTFVSVLGKIQNESDVTWGNIHFEVRFFDSDKKLIDAISDNDYDLVVLPNSESAFRIRGRADKSESSYDHYEIIIKKARESKGWL